jgi:ribose 5-phosphate isomerase A
MKSDVNSWKTQAAKAAAKFVKDGMVVGLGSGTTMVEVVKNIERKKKVVFVPASLMIEKAARKMGLKLGNLGVHDRLDLVLDGADEVDEDFNMIKGKGGAHVREKIIAKAARRVVIVVARTKLVSKLGERSPVPVEVLPFAVGHVEKKLEKLGGIPRPRLGKDGKPYTTDNGNRIIDVKFTRIPNAVELERKINEIPGVVDNGIFVGLVDTVVVGNEDGTYLLRAK